MLIHGKVLRAVSMLGTPSLSNVRYSVLIQDKVLQELRAHP